MDNDKNISDLDFAHEYYEKVTKESNIKVWSYTSENLTKEHNFKSFSLNHYCRLLEMINNKELLFSEEYKEEIDKLLNA